MGMCKNQGHKKIICVYQTKSGVKAHTSGLVVSITHPWLAATPDGLVTDPQEGIGGLVEYKNP